MAGARSLAAVPALLLLLLAPAPAPAAQLAARTGHPVEKVIGLLQDLTAKAEEEGKAEEVTYTKFEYWCSTSRKTLADAIAEEKSKIEQLEDQIDSHEKTIEVLGKEIEALEDDLQKLDADGQEVQKQRDAAKNLYALDSGAHSQTIEGIVQALDALKKSKSDTKTLLLSQNKVRAVVALLGLQASAEQLTTLSEFANYEPKDRPELKAKSDYEGHIKKYSFKSDSVIELLKELKLKFEDELTEMNTEETNAINAHELTKKARKQIRDAKDASKKEKAGAKGDTEGALGTAQSDLGATQGDLDADSKSLDNTNKACDLKKSEWIERSEVRAGERKAIAAAIAILAKATGVRTEAPGNPVPPPSPVAFLEVQATGSPKAQRALQLLREEARVVHSQALEQLAQELAAKKEGPFDQIVNAIQKMIFHLQHEQKEEDDHKNWCDLELEKTNTSIVDKQAKLDELALKIEGHGAHATSLADDMQEADEMVAKITQHVKESTEIRNIGKKENALAIKDAQDAQTAVSNAISVLKDFYKGSGAIVKESWEFVQRAADPVTLPETPSTWDSSYTKVADPQVQPDGIVSVLEWVSADFSKMESDTVAQEETDQDAYDEDVKSCAIEKARRMKESEMKAQERQRVLQKKSAMEAQHKSVSGEHEATVQYQKDLQPACVEGSSTYADRKAARATEIEALTEAQGMLQEAFEKPEEGTTGGSFLQLRRRALRGA